VAGRAETLEEGVREAEAAIDDGRAARTLDTLVALTQELAVPA
jgi:anthranilate phosphoribosyltransferase